MHPVIDVAPWVEKLGRHLQVARAGRQPEGVHQARVATRRVQAWLRLARMAVLVDDLRWVRAAMGADRDLHVFLVSRPEDPLRAFLRGRKRVAREQVRAVVDAPRTQALLTALQLLRPLPRSVAEANVVREFDRVRADGQAFEANPHEEEALHRLRRHIKSLRYCLDFLEVDRPSLRLLQDSLGAGNDAIVALRLVNQYPDPEAMEGIRRSLVDRIEGTRNDAVAAWRQHRLDLFA
jgi:CHAD domain-containing protein